MLADGAGTWLHFVGARALAWMSTTGGADTVAALCDAGAIKALLAALGAKPDLTCGDKWGVPDVPAKLQVVARHTLAVLTGCEGTEVEGGIQDGMLAVSLYLLGDYVEIVGLESKAELNGASGKIIGTAAGGFGPDIETSRYSLRIDLPLKYLGTCIRVKLANLRLRG